MTKSACCKGKDSCCCKTERPIARASWKRNQTMEPQADAPNSGQHRAPNPHDEKLEPQ